MKTNFVRAWLVSALLGVLVFQGGPSHWTSSSVVSAQGRSPFACGQSVAISTAAASTVSLVAEVANQSIEVCAFVINGAGATTAKFVRGTGATCGTGTTDLTGAMSLVAGSSIPHGNGAGVVFRLPVGQRLCMTNSAAVQVSGVLTYGFER